jgi:hypothetical protein
VGKTDKYLDKFFELEKKWKEGKQLNKEFTYLKPAFTGVIYTLLGKQGHPGSIIHSRNEPLHNAQRQQVKKIHPVHSAFALRLPVERTIRFCPSIIPADISKHFPAMRRVPRRRISARCIYDIFHMTARAVISNTHG